ncbi:MAG: hypothetical protein UZ16_OP3001002179 [Candidatus Hinthialibacteria bacterium OLB16]|nr:MAG: hypothetical protein UZ16_OP3001002179 [Candidatus Hinthialibacteria bacterium OLB16]
MDNIDFNLGIKLEENITGSIHQVVHIFTSQLSLAECLLQAFQ